MARLAAPSVFQVARGYCYRILLLLGIDCWPAKYMCQPPLKELLKFVGHVWCALNAMPTLADLFMVLDMPGHQSISGLVVEYIVAIDVTRVRFPADAYLVPLCSLPVSSTPSSVSARKLHFHAASQVYA